MSYSWWGRGPDRAETPTDPLAEPVQAAKPARRAWRLLTTRGRLPASVCGLCAALVVADGAEQHERHHTATTTPGGQR